ncbi:histidinol phosphate phosphatase [Heliobacterium chlorum]|uniref:Histidinol-phosphatase n=1 Tax=Heliobacterium chlorum TaxID=2698 RepID=A0ABR7T8I2_HELCL|nr:histidinol phosphate phosphatase [Heliobacterium chlorum]MBC9786056.1 histidinol phosphate phosphatase [Heliobacterium chlorum]
MIFDSHVHTRFSTDSQMFIEEAIAKAKSLDIGIIVTEHMDLEYPQPEFFKFNLDDYFREYDRYRNPRLRLGIEMGMRCELAEKSREMAAQYPFDFIIGSVHVVDKKEIYPEAFYQGRSKKEAYDRYFDTMYACVKGFDFVDTLGHIDYICRYAALEDPEIDYVDFRDRIDPILTLLAERGQAIEINSRRFDNPRAVESLFPIYRRFRELGGQWVTIGSDAHNPSDIGRRLDKALELAERCQLRPIWFDKRKPQLMK